MKEKKKKRERKGERYQQRIHSTAMRNVMYVCIYTELLNPESGGVCAKKIEIAMNLNDG